MPFDEAGFPKRQHPPQRKGPHDNTVSLLIVVLAFCLLVMPISLGVIVDIARYLRTH